MRLPLRTEALAPGWLESWVPPEPRTLTGDLDGGRGPLVAPETISPREFRLLVLRRRVREQLRERVRQASR